MGGVEEYDGEGWEVERWEVEDCLSEKVAVEGQNFSHLLSN